MFFSFLSSIYPCYENGLDSIWGGFYLFSLLIMLILYIARAQNRRTIAKRFFGVQLESESERIIKERSQANIIYFNALYYMLPILNTIFVLLYYPWKVSWKTRVWHLFILFGPAFSIPMGTHRFYSHRAFKASKLYQMIIMFLNCMVKQESIIHWARDHRCHHKFTDTNADPYNAKRGLFFCHYGWMMVEKHPDVIKKGKTLDITDLTSNPILAFQRRYLFILMPFFHFILPWSVPYFFFGERFWACYFFCVDYPYVIITVLVTGFVNSWCHYDGKRPYNNKITASDGGIFRNLATLGEGYHNFHHAFPQDYRSIDFPSWTNVGTNLIYACSLIGLTWDLKTTSPDLVKRKKDKSDIFG